MTIPPWHVPDSSRHGILQPGREDALAHDLAERGLDKGIFDLDQFLGPGEPIENWLQHYIAALAYIDGELVRPRWQMTPPNLPEIGTSWIAVGITRRKPIGPYAWVGHHAHGQGRSELQRHEEFEYLCSFYGPKCDVYAELVHSNLMVWQNVSLLRLVWMAFVEIGEGVRVPELVKQQWLDRVDKTITFRRIIRRNYPVLNVLSAHGVIHAQPDQYELPFETPWTEREGV
jgi:hypothetical protein